MLTDTPVSVTLPPWIGAQTQHLLTQRGHAWLLHGPSGLGQYPLALELAKAWLCENPSHHGACGACGSCHAITVCTHADLCVLMPETTMLELAWPLSEKAQAEIDDKKRKPSKEIRVDAMRDAVEFAQRTSARGRGKVVLVFPAEQMNTITANALLKTQATDKLAEQRQPGICRQLLFRRFDLERKHRLCQFPHRPASLNHPTGARFNTESLPKSPRIRAFHGIYAVRIAESGHFTSQRLPAPTPCRAG